MSRAGTITMLLASMCVALTGCDRPERISHGLFDEVALYRPRGEPRHFVLFFSGDDGWSRSSARIARVLVDQGAMVAGIDTPRLFARLEAAGGACTFPDGDLENLAHYVQGYAQLDSYHTPLLVGYSAGATFAYAMLAQTKKELFAGVVTLAFCADLDLAKPLCPGEGTHYRRRPDGRVQDLLPSSQPLHWIALQGAEDQVCPVDLAQRFVAQVPEARVVTLPTVAHRFAGKGEWQKQLVAAYAEFGGEISDSTPLPAELSGLPLIDVPTPVTTGPNSDTFAVLVSGDGGWAGLDKDVAAAMSAQGVPVVGIDSLRYFWSRRTPEGVARDVDRVLQHYAARWQRSRAVLIGYSQGANVLPFVVNRLSPAVRATVAQTVLIGLEPDASWEFHLDNWIGRSRDSTPVMPEAARLEAASTLCLYGEEEQDSLCPQLPAGSVTPVKLPGDHHFNGAYASLAKVILEKAR